MKKAANGRQRFCDYKTLTEGDFSDWLGTLPGYSVLHALQLRQDHNGGAYNEDFLNSVKRELFLYFDEAVYRRFDAPL
ncbi:hypothetical protein OBV_14530 [Oscillibacter valericigenes Sjm18-20]|nr:hypothetical protein OBV_14530 [Oscillibacter valericigenes Sjm18-20]